MAGATGGTSFDTARNLTDLDAAFTKIAEEMHSLYSIAYVSSNSKKDGSFREIKVTVDRSEGRVRSAEAITVATDPLRPIPIPFLFYRAQPTEPPVRS